MTALAAWNAAIPNGMFHRFSPSGHALAFQRSLPMPFMRSLDVYFADGRRPLLYEDDAMITIQTWVSDAELVYWKWKEALPPGTNANGTLHVLNVANGRSRLLAKLEGRKSIVGMGASGHLCVLTEAAGRQGLFDLDTRTGNYTRMTPFDKAFDGLTAYPSFGHAWSALRREAALLAWPHDYLEEGIEPTAVNSAWSTVLDEPSIQKIVVDRPDGSQITQQQSAQQAKRKKAFRLFLLNQKGERIEVPGTEKAEQPLWSPDGSVLTFKRQEEASQILWLLGRSDLSVRRVGTLCSPDPFMHPAGVLYYRTVDEDIPTTNDRWVEHLSSAAWVRLVLENGHGTPLK